MAPVKHHWHDEHPSWTFHPIAAVLSTTRVQHCIRIVRINIHIRQKLAYTCVPRSA